ncbi:MAG: tetratricopeptide repeat protein [Ignavibacteriaceae bacterium]|jgi:tetratricopeptide (TPR) repeat protein|nr:tetratricopeptide repeat protein [Ignavibacteriaceae bacterium]
MKISRLMTLLAVVLLTTPTNAQTEQTYSHYYPKLPKVEMSEAKTNLAYLLRETRFATKNGHKTPENVDVFDDRFEMTFKNKYKRTFYFSYMLNFALGVTETFYPDYKFYTWFISLGDYTISKSRDDLEKLTDYFYFFQYQLLTQRYDSLIAVFEPLATQYRALKVKPSVSEEQRKYIVQANAFNQQKMYKNAIELYCKAIEIDPTAYPAAYTNLALLSAQILDFQAAIFYMKKYLLLEPEADDARSSQDKIYEWEAKIGK